MSEREECGNCDYGLTMNCTCPDDEVDDDIFEAMGRLEQTLQAARDLNGR